jgi:tetratricopeptide (TPR) repeat protein
MANRSRKEQIEAMLAEDPNDPFLRYGLAMEHASAGDLEAAVRCFRELIERTPNYAPAYLQAGQALTRLDREAEARAMYRAGIAAARQNGDPASLHAAGEMEQFLDNLG